MQRLLLALSLAAFACGDPSIGGPATATTDPTGTNAEQQDPSTDNNDANPRDSDPGTTVTDPDPTPQDPSVDPNVDPGPDPNADPGPGPNPQPPLTIAERCFPDRIPTGNQWLGPDYDQFGPRIGSHCMGTSHQHIYGIQDVVFLGDSITVGTPPALSTDFYRTQLADSLVGRFNLSSPNYLWRIANPVSGEAGTRESGNFRNCSKWGARTDDLLGGGDQIAKCFPDGGSDRRTLVIMTIGGNDVSKLTQTTDIPMSESQQMVENSVEYLEEAIAWLTDPVRFPNGSFVIFANPYEFTDGTGDINSCPGAAIVDVEPWEDPDALAAMIIWMNEQFMRIAVESGTDMILLLEHFCGHGYVATGTDADPNARCYLGPNTQRWFDQTCIHPNALGHAAISDMFMNVINEIGSPP